MNNTSMNNNQLDALFIFSLFSYHTSTCFGRISSPSSGAGMEFHSSQACRQLIQKYATYRIILNYCPDFNSLSHTIHFRQQYVFAQMDQGILKVFFNDVRCAVVMHYIMLIVQHAGMLQTVWNELDYRVDISSVLCMTSC
jgi:hypothetical protein